MSFGLFLVFTIQIFMMSKETEKNHFKPIYFIKQTGKKKYFEKVSLI